MDNNNRSAISELHCTRPIFLTFFAVSVLLGISTLLILVVSFTQPRVPTERLYEISGWARWVALGAVVLGVTALLSLKLAANKVIQIQLVVRRAFHKIPAWFTVAVAICLSVLLFTAMHGFRNVHPEGGIWISTGHAGRWPVAEPVARLFLWLSIRASSLTALLMALLVSFASRRILVGTLPPK
jgi:hypothetical protein